MKFYSLAAIGLVAMVDAKDKVDPKENTKWYVDGIKGYHSGFEKAFYKSSSHDLNKECMDDTTIDNMVRFGTILTDPFSIFSDVTDIQKDFNLFADAAEIMENLSKCRFEGPAVELLTLCAKDADACAMPKLLENLTKNMFVLVGKMTSLAETLKDFPAKDKDDFQE